MELGLPDLSFLSQKMKGRLANSSSLSSLQGAESDFDNDDDDDSVTQSYLTLCDPMDCSPPGSSVHVILRTRILEWVAMPSSKGQSWD